jgi:hypothetical protein
MPYPPPEENKNCRCYPNMMQAFFCNQGHMTECHVGMDCATAVCGHLPRYVQDSPETYQALINSPTFIAQERIHWFDETKGTNEPDCLCSICLKPISPSERDIASTDGTKQLPPLRLLQEQLNLECRFHPGECFEVIRPLIDVMRDRGLIDENDQRLREGGL